MGGGEGGGREGPTFINGLQGLNRKAENKGTGQVEKDGRTNKGAGVPRVQYSRTISL